MEPCKLRVARRFGCRTDFCWVESGGVLGWIQRSGNSCFLGSFEWGSVEVLLSPWGEFDAEHGYQPQDGQQHHGQHECRHRQFLPPGGQD